MSIMAARFSAKEKAFLSSNEVCRFATASKDGRPQVTPVIYAMDGSSVVIATDYGTKKLKNVRENSNVALVVDHFHPNKAVIIEGTCIIYERGDEYKRLLKILFDTFETYRKHPWSEGESPIFRIDPTKVISWGL